jgi:hypothetical protein
MRRSLTIKIEEKVLNSANARAQQDNRSVTEYIEELIRRDLNIPDSTEEVEVFAPKNARDFRAVPLPGETKEETELADQAFQAILDRAGH